MPKSGLIKAAARSKSDAGEAGYRPLRDGVAVPAVSSAAPIAPPAAPPVAPVVEAVDPRQLGLFAGLGVVL
jgi:hypothetical protein